MTHEVEAAAYILRALEEIEKNGDAYTEDEAPYQVCKAAHGMTFAAYKADVTALRRAEMRSQKGGEQGAPRGAKRAYFACKAGKSRV